MQEHKMNITLTEQEALDLMLIIAAKQADLLHKKIHGGILEWHEIRIAASLRSAQDKIDREAIKIYRNDLRTETSLKLVRKGDVEL